MTVEPRSVTGRILIGGKVAGTAWRTQPDLAITAAHCLRVSALSSDYHTSCQIAFADASELGTATVRDLDAALDVAILQLAAPGHHVVECASLPWDDARVIGELKQPWQSYGYPDAKPDGLGLNGTITHVGERNERGIQLLCEQGGQGYLKHASGAPVIIGDRAVALIVWNPEPLAQRVIFARPLDQVARRFTYLKVPVHPRFREGNHETPQHFLAQRAFSSDAGEGHSESIGHQRFAAISFEARPKYPTLKFSVLNLGSVPIQITSIRVVKAGAAKDEHGSTRYSTGPRVRLDFSIKSAREHSWTDSFDGVSNLAPREAEAFLLNLECVNSVNVVDLEIEVISVDCTSPEVVLPDQVVLVHAPIDETEAVISMGSITLPLDETEAVTSMGAIALPRRHELVGAMISGTVEGIWGDNLVHCDKLMFALFRSAAFICRDDLCNGWSRLRSKFEGSGFWGPIAASFADYGLERPLPPEVESYLLASVKDPRLIRQLSGTDLESFSLAIMRLAVARKRTTRHE